MKHKSFVETERDDIISSLIEYVNIPFDYIRKWTIPPCDEI